MDALGAYLAAGNSVSRAGSVAISLAEMPTPLQGIGGPLYDMTEVPEEEAGADQS